MIKTFVDALKIFSHHDLNIKGIFYWILSKISATIGSFHDDVLHIFNDDDYLEEELYTWITFTKNVDNKNEGLRVYGVKNDCLSFIKSVLNLFVKNDK